MTHEHNHTSENTHLLKKFEYIEPCSLDETLTLLTEYGEKAQLIAGGTDLLAKMKINRENPETIIDIGRIPELHRIFRDDQGSLIIGSATSIHDLRYHPIINRSYTALSDACAAFGSKQIEVMGTIGGNVCNGSPASDSVPALLVFGAQVVLQSVRGERRLPLEEFLLGPGKTAIRDDELLVAIVLPPPIEDVGSAFLKVSRVAADLAKISAAVMLVRDGSNIVECRLAFGSVAPTVVRTKIAENYLVGNLFSQELLHQAGTMVKEAISPIDDIRSTAWYRREISSTLTVDASNLAWERAGNLPVKEEAEMAVTISPAAPKETRRISPDGTMEMELRINYGKYKLQVAPNELLLDVLRDRLNLTGAKYGCGLGECGTCAILVDGKAVLSCLLLAASMDGREIATVESLQSSSGELDPIQQSFIAETAYQCGYCTSGFLMLTRSLLNEIAQPNEGQIRDYFKGSRCRCTGYASIVQAVLKSVAPGESNGVTDVANV